MRDSLHQVVYVDDMDLLTWKLLEDSQYHFKKSLSLQLLQLSNKFRQERADCNLQLPNQQMVQANVDTDATVVGVFETHNGVRWYRTIVVVQQ